MKEKTPNQRLQEIMTDEFIGQLLMGAKIIDSYLPNGEKNKGFILIAFGNPLKYAKDDREFYYRQYGIYDGKLYHATDYVKMRVKEAKRRAWENK